MDSLVSRVVAVSSLFVILSILFKPSHSDLGGDALDGPEYTVNLLDVVPCDPEHKDQLKMEWSDVTVTRITRTKYGLNAKLKYKGKIEATDHWAMKMKLHWQNGPDANTKRQIAEFEMANMCDELLKNNTDTDNFFASVHGGINRYCPMEPGEYELKDFECDMDSMQGVLQPGLWFIDMDETINGEPSSCNIITMEVKEK